jgi:hypothetical protein
MFPEDGRLRVASSSKLRFWPMFAVAPDWSPSLSVMVAVRVTGSAALNQRIG